jgi:hypothetical protein
MLNVKDLINITYIPSETEISLDLFVSFYEEYLCKRIFVYTLYNGEKVKLFFKDTAEIFHVSGIEHIYQGVPMNGTRFIDEVKKGNIDLNTLNKVNPKAYIDYKDRIRSLACIDTIIKNCEYLWYPNGKIENSSIEVSYLLLKGLDGKYLHLGIDTYRKNRPYFAKTLLVTEGNSLNKFLEKAQEKIRVESLLILSKEDDEILEDIQRKKAEDLSKELVLNSISQWQDEQLSYLVNEFYEEIILKSDNQNWKNVVSDIIGKYETGILDKLTTFVFNSDGIAECIREQKNASGEEKNEWIKLLVSEIETLLLNTPNLHGVFGNVIRDNIAEEFTEILFSFLNRCKKSIVIASLEKMLENEKISFLNEVKLHDKYWANKLIAENMRHEKKRYIDEQLDNALAEIIENNKRIYLEWFWNKISIDNFKDLNRIYCKKVVDKFNLSINDVYRILNLIENNH